MSPDFDGVGWATRDQLYSIARDLCVCVRVCRLAPNLRKVNESDNGLECSMGSWVYFKYKVYFHVIIAADDRPSTAAFSQLTAESAVYDHPND